MTADISEIMKSMWRQRAALDPRDEKWAEWHMHPDTLYLIERETYRHLPPDTFSPVPPPDAERRHQLQGYPVRMDFDVPVGEVKLVAETDLDATVRHIVAAGGVVNISKPVFEWPEPTPPAPAPTAKALIRHWLSRLQKRP